MDDILKVVGAFVLASGGLSAVVYGAFKLFAQKWLESKFSEKLASYKHEQDKEIERLRFKINTMLDRAVKFHQHEFEVIPEAWALLNDAYWATSAFISPYQQYPDLNKMTPTHLEEFVSSSILQDWEKDEILNETDKTESYIKRIFWHTLQNTTKTARDFNIYIVKNGIFLQPEIHQPFKDLNDLIWKAINGIESNQKYKVYPLDFTSRDKFLQEGPQHLENLEQLIQTRLWSTEA
jgi:hypothetical protein